MSPLRCVELPAPFPYQREILMSPARFKVACIGRQAGKTLCGGIAALFGHGPLDAKGIPLYRGALFGSVIQWTSKDYENTDKIWASLRHYLRGWGGELGVSLKRRTITFPGGGAIVVRSAHKADSLRGPTIHGAINDELAFWHPDALNTLRPALGVYKGWEFNISTPFGFNWFFDEWRHGKEKTLPDYESWQWPSTVSPAFTAEQFELEKSRTPPLVFAREFLAEFSVSEGEIFRRDWFRFFRETEKQLVPDVGEPVSVKDLQTFLSADFALTAKDYSDHTAIAVVSVARDGRMFMRDMQRVKITRADLVPRIKRLQEQHGAIFVYVESSGELANLNAEMRRAGVRIRERKIHQKIAGKKGEDKVTRAYEAAKAVQLAKISFLKVEQPNRSFVPARWANDLMAECGAFDGRKGGSDDQVDALSLGVLGAPFVFNRPTRSSWLDGSSHGDHYIRTDYQ